MSKNMAKKLLPIIIVVIVVAGAAFYGGMKYGEGKAPRGFTQANLQNLRNLSPEERQQKLQETGADMGSGFEGRRLKTGESGAGLVNGEIIAKDDQSITVKLRDGGSKIIFFSESTKIEKSVDGTGDDLKEGTMLSVSGKENPDGSYTAKTIRISPND